MESATGSGLTSRSFLLRTTELLSRGGSARDVMSALAREASRFCGAGQASMYLFNEDGELSGHINAGLRSDVAVELEKLGHTQWAANYLGSSDGPSLVGTSEQGVYPSPIHKVAHREGFEALLSVPMFYEGKLRGLALFYFEHTPELDAERIEALRIAAGYAALALAHGQLVETRNWERRAQDQFLDMLSHELRTPLTSIMGFAQIIRRRIAISNEIDGRLRDQLDMLWAQAQRLNRLLDTFVDVTNIERGDFTIAREPVDVTQLLKYSLDQSLAQAHSGHRIEAQVSDRPIWISGDLKRLQHVFIHVIANALRYTPEDKPITIACAEVADSGEVLIRVADRGPGMPADTRRDIFKRFYPTGTRKSGGMGVGLYVSKAIVEAHGGRLLVDSKPGAGTTVDILLPLG